MKTGRLSKEVGQKERIIRYYYENPLADMSIRQFANDLEMSRSTVHSHLKQLQLMGMIDGKNKWVDNWINKLRKTNYYIEKIALSGLVQYLEKELAASAIILFGSFRKGESVKESDIDLFVECGRNKQLNLVKYEKNLGHKIELFTKSKITQLPSRLFNNVVNGITLKGYYTIK